MDTDNESVDQFDLLLVLSTRAAKPLALGLLSAAERKQLRVAVFLTGQGAVLAAYSELGRLLSNLSSAVVCTESWEACKANSEFESDSECGAELGSQTNHSQLVGNAIKVISL